MFDGDAADAVGHVLVHDGADAVSGVRQFNLERVGNVVAYGALGFFFAQLHFAAQSRFGIQIAQHNVGIGHGRQIAALLVASGARVRAGAVWAHFQHAKRIHMRNRAAACAQGFHVYHRHADAVAQEVDVAVEAGLAVFGHGDVKRGAAHVHGNHVVDAKRLGNEQACLRR